MRNNYTNKRPRFRGHYRDRSPQGAPSSSGSETVPDARARASAQKNLDKYLGLARDAAAAGDRVLAENFYQHADHYARIVHAAPPPGQGGNRHGGNGATPPATPGALPEGKDFPSPEAPEAVVIDVDVESSDTPAPAAP